MSSLFPKLGRRSRAIAPDRVFDAARGVHPRRHAVWLARRGFHSPHALHPRHHGLTTVMRTVAPAGCNPGIAGGNCDLGQYDGDGGWLWQQGGELGENRKKAR